MTKLVRNIGMYQRFNQRGSASMTIVSWNVNGIRAVWKKGLLDFVKKENPDILCLQEIKINYEYIPLRQGYAGQANHTNELIPGYKAYWNFAKKPGYSGTAIFINHKWTNNTNHTNKIKNIIYGIGNKKFDNEGRVLTLEFEKFYLINTYFPHSNRELKRLDFKLEFNEKFLDFTKKLKSYSPKKLIVIAGDLNVAHKEIDLANPKENQKNAGFLPQERAWMDKLLASGYIDSFREFTKEGGHYTWWTHWANARARNIGWRIDYFIVSQELRKNLISSKILPEILGSDHCPIELDLKL